MPTGYYEPEEFMEHNGVTIYHAYKDGDMDRRLTYWYNASGSEEPEYEFDIRELPGGCNLDQSSGLVAEESIKAVIRAALDAGLIKLDQEG
jgi:hypothetical protein